VKNKLGKGILAGFSFDSFVVGLNDLLSCGGKFKLRYFNEVFR
jgi:hypothetical protein